MRTTVWAGPLTSPSSPLPNHCHLWSPPAPQAATVLSHSIHPYQASTCSHFISPSGLPTFPCHLHPQRFQTCCHLPPCFSCGPGCVPNADTPVSCLLPLHCKTSLSLLFSLWHVLLGLPGPHSALPWPLTKERHLTFSYQLGAAGCFPTAACVGLLSLVGTPKRGGGCGGHQGGPVLHPSTHLAAALPTWGSWSSRDGRRRVLGTGPDREEVGEGLGGNSWGRRPGEDRVQPGYRGQH